MDDVEVGDVVEEETSGPAQEVAIECGDSAARI